MRDVLLRHFYTTVLAHGAPCVDSALLAMALSVTPCSVSILRVAGALRISVWVEDGAKASQRVLVGGTTLLVAPYPDGMSRSTWAKSAR